MCKPLPPQRVSTIVFGSAIYGAPTERQSHWQPMSAHFEADPLERGKQCWAKMPGQCVRFIKVARVQRQVHRMDRVLLLVAACRRVPTGRRSLGWCAYVRETSSRACKWQRSYSSLVIEPLSCPVPSIGSQVKVGLLTVAKRCNLFLAAKLAKHLSSWPSIAPSRLSLSLAPLSTAAGLFRTACSIA